MKKLLVIFCIILTILPMYAFAAKSPIITNKIYSIPSIKFEAIDNELEILDLDKQLSLDELDGYIWCEVLRIKLDKEYEEIKWHLLVEIQEPRVVIIGETLEIKDAIIDEKGMIVVDFTGYKSGTYYLCFFTKETPV